MRLNERLMTRVVSLLAVVMLAFAFSCSVGGGGGTTPTGIPSTLRILPNQTISANIDNTGYTNFNAQTILADGGSPLHSYDWSLDLSSNPPLGVTIEPFTGVISRIGTSSTGLSVGKTTFKVKVSDGSAVSTGSVSLIVTGYTPGPAAILQQLSSGFQLKDGEANKAYGASLWAMGGTPPYSWKLDDTYPGSTDLTMAGLTVDATSGIVRGTILNSASGKSIKFKVIVTDHSGDVADDGPVYTIKIN